MSPWAVVDWWVFRMNMQFAASASVSGRLAEFAGVGSRLAHLGEAARRPTPWRFGIAAAMGLSLWIPQKLIEHLPGEWLLRRAVWNACSVALAVSHVRTSRFRDIIRGGCRGNPG